jgi:hypothetical protein
VIAANGTLETVHSRTNRCAVASSTKERCQHSQLRSKPSSGTDFSLGRWASGHEKRRVAEFSMGAIGDRLITVYNEFRY